MKRWARKLSKPSRWRGAAGDDGLSLPQVDDFRPIDTQEQEELVRSLEKAEAQQSRLYRGVFAGLTSCYPVFVIYSIYQQANYPWELKYHAYFMEDIDSHVVIIADCVAVLACLLSIVGILQSSVYHRRLIWYSCSIGILLSFFWFYYMIRMPKFRWDIIWLPVAPLSSAGVCLHVDRLLNESSEEVRRLRNYMYAYKAR
ncbi:hypothetical protein Droror1_Dr00007331 [Drosera rotundifolia]